MTQAPSTAPSAVPDARDAASVEIVRRRGSGALRAGSALGPLASIAALVCVLLVLVAVFAPWLAPASPDAVDPLNVFAGPTGAHLLGTDDTGRDLLSRLIYGARPSLAGPFLVVLLSATVGTALGVAAAWNRGVADAVLSRLFDLLFAFPGIVLALLATTMFGAGFIAPVLALSVAYLPLVARLMRAAALKERSLPYIEALQIQGASAWRIAVRHLLPNIVPLLLVQATIGFGYALLDLAAISFLGLGLQPPTADWGVMIADGKPSILDGDPQQSLYAAVTVVIAVVAVNLVGERLAARYGVAGPVMTAPLLELRGLEVDLRIGGELRPVIRGVDLALAPGEALGLVGESGSGKSVTARSVLHLLPRGAAVRGQIHFDGERIDTLRGTALRRFRSRSVAMVFQDPRAHVNPVRTVGDFVTEALVAAHGRTRRDAERIAVSLMTDVGIANAQHRLRQRPYELSGGLLQRVMIAAALAIEPRLILADEPTTALDVTTQEEVMAILDELRRERGLALLFITHDLELAAAVCDRMAVMYAGRIVEASAVAQLHDDARHPYTRALLAARTRDALPGERLRTVPGNPQAAYEAPSGCAFRSRCPVAVEACVDQPALRTVAATLVACHRAEHLAVEVLPR